MNTNAVLKKYESPRFNQALDQVLHPGGLELTARMAQVAGIKKDSYVLDVGSGRGTSLLYLVKEFSCQGRGVDLSPASVAIAAEHSASLGFAKQAQFNVAGASELPYAEAEFDVVFCECTLSLVTRKAAAVREFARVIRPGGRVVISDVVLEHKLSDSFKNDLGFVCCFTEALTLEGYEQLFSIAGLHKIMVEDYSIELKKLAYKLSLGYGSLDQFWTQFGQGEAPCCGTGSQYATSDSRWKLLFKQGKPGYWLLAWEKPILCES